MYSVRLFRIFTTNTPCYKEYMLIKMRERDREREKERRNTTGKMTGSAQEITLGVN
jgi:hypothetical protein